MATESRRGFTLIELLVVVAIIALLISIMMPSLGRAREQAKSVHCLARLHEFGTALVSYATDYNDTLPPAMWYATGTESRTYGEPLRYGWTELLWSYIYREDVLEPEDFPVQRNIHGSQWAKYALCKTANQQGQNSGHYRVYLPSWSYGTYDVGRGQRWILHNRNLGEGSNLPDPLSPTQYARLRPKLVLLGDANEYSYRGDGYGLDDTSWIDAGEANDGGYDGNRFSDRHYGFTCFLFADWHADKDAKLRQKLARDWDLNGVVDVDVVGENP